MLRAVDTISKLRQEFTLADCFDHKDVPPTRISTKCSEDLDAWTRHWKYTLIRPNALRLTLMALVKDFTDSEAFVAIAFELETANEVMQCSTTSIVLSRIP